MNEKPLFIPLKTQFFEQFKSGVKQAEYRPHGPRWNALTCRLGRAVVLSKGYGKVDRITGKVTAFSVLPDATVIPGWSTCYGDRKGEAARIFITLDRSPSVLSVSSVVKLEKFDNFRNV